MFGYATAALIFIYLFLLLYHHFWSQFLDMWKHKTVRYLFIYRLNCLTQYCQAEIIYCVSVTAKFILPESPTHEEFPLIGDFLLKVFCFIDAIFL